jgi:hypothetical protein
MIGADHTGKVFGRLTVLSKAESVRYEKQTAARWFVKCQCGNEKIVSATKLVSGSTKSCGCLKRELAAKSHTTHDMRWHPFYRIWAKMRGRCLCKTDAAYLDYGGRGITICEKWSDFSLFVSDMGERPKGFTLERLDNDKGYSPDNCKWASRKEQARNRRSSRILEINGIEKCLAEWCEFYNLQYGTVLARINKGWSVSKAFELPAIQT